jgi:nicotinamidase-related amidase
VIWVRHGAPAQRNRPSFLPVRHSASWALADAPEVGDVVVDCSGWDGCFGSALDHELRSSRRATVVLGGFASELTVDSTVRTLNDQGHECLVLSDGCAPLDAHLGMRAQHSLTMSGGIFGALGTTAALLDSLTSTSKETPA